MLSTSQSTSLNDRTTSSNRNVFGRLFSRDIGDSINKAKKIGTLSRSKSYSNSGDVGGKDLDFYEFKLDRSLRITAKLENEDKDNNPIALTILNRNGKAVTGSDGKFLFKNVTAGNTRELSTTLQSGTYYVRLESAQGRNQDYDFELSASRGSGSGGGGGNGGGNGGNSGIDFDDARNLGRLDSGRTYNQSGSVGGNDEDVYSFSVDRTSRILAELTNNGNDDVAFRLLDSSGQTVKKANGNFLFSNVNPDDSETLLAPTLGAGTYYFAIQSSVGRNEDYNFSLRQSSASVTPI
jgi:hypothetical protein